MGENSDDEETPTGWYYRTLAEVECDNKDEFVRLMKHVSSDLDKACVISEICSQDAADCLAAILDGQTGDETLAIYLSELEDNIPLHQAARRRAPRIASLLLDKGFSPDLRTDYDDLPVCLKNALPLNVSLDYARFNIWESYYHGGVQPWKSPTYQVIEFCQMASYNAVTRVIARKTTEIKHEFFKYLKQGKVFEVGALLAIASDLIMSPSSTIDGENGGDIGFKNIMEMRQFLLAEMSRSLGASNTQLKEIKKTLRLLEIFDRVGEKLVKHMPLWDKNPSASRFKVISLIEFAAYDEGEKAEYDHDAVPSAYYTPSPLPSCDEYETTDDETTSPDVAKTITIYPSRLQNFHCTKKFSTKIHFPRVHFPSWLKEQSSHDNAPLPLPTTLKGVVRKHVLSEKHASFIGAVAKSVRRLRYR